MGVVLLEVAVLDPEFFLQELTQQALGALHRTGPIRAGDDDPMTRHAVALGEEAPTAPLRHVLEGVECHHGVNRFRGEGQGRAIAQHQPLLV